VANLHDFLSKSNTGNGSNSCGNSQLQFHLHRQLQVKNNCELNNSATSTIQQFLRQLHRVDTKIIDINT
jgi:hypothetical protein